MNVLVLVLRGLHLGYLGCYGNDWIDTPTLDRLAAEGVVFDQHFSNHPDPAGAWRAWRTGRYHFPDPDGSEPAPPDEPADLFRLLEVAGGSVCAISDPFRSPDAVLSAVREALEVSAGAERALVWAELAALLPPWDVPEEFLDVYFRSPQRDEEEDESEPASEPLTDPVAGFLDPHDDNTFLRLRQTYASTVTYLDQELGGFLEHLRGRGILDRLALVVTTDRGIPLGEHGILLDHRPWLHEELIHLPLILRLPNRAEAGRRVAALTQPVDLMPTGLDLLGLPVPPGVHAHSMLPLARGESAEVRSYACAGLHHGNAVEWALRSPDWAYLLPLREAPGDLPRKPQFYLKPEDRWEVNEVSQHHLELTEHLERTLRGFVAATRLPGPLQPPELHDLGNDLPVDEQPK